MYDDGEKAPDFDHSVFDSLLRRHVDAEGWVDYAGIKKEEVKLDVHICSQSPMHHSRTWDEIKNLPCSSMPITRLR